MVKVSVVCLAYNQEKLIRRALDGFVMQKTNFPFEVIVHDDASTDKTADIIREYQQKYPDIIKPIFQKENTFSRRLSYTFTEEFLSQVHGEYVALCEGDDYWTDENKLQIQADFLDAHPEYSICFHPILVKWDNDEHKPHIYPAPKDRFNKTVLGLEDILTRNFIQTNSVMYRGVWTSDMNPGPILPGDWYLHILYAQNGKIGFIDKVMGVYFHSSGSLWSNQGTDAFYLRNGLAHLRFYEAVEKQFGVNRTKERLTMCKATADAALRAGNQEIIDELLEKHCETIKLSYNDNAPTKTARLRKQLKLYRKLSIIFGTLAMMLMLYIIMN